MTKVEQNVLILIEKQFSISSKFICRPNLYSKAGLCPSSYHRCLTLYYRNGRGIFKFRFKCINYEIFTEIYSIEYLLVQGSNHVFL